MFAPCRNCGENKAGGIAGWVYCGDCQKKLGVDPYGESESSEPKKVQDSVDSPFRVLVDTREQLPYTFAGLSTDSAQKYRPLRVRTLTSALSAGDYSIEGYGS